MGQPVALYFQMEAQKRILTLLVLNIKYCVKIDMILYKDMIQERTRWVIISIKYKSFSNENNFFKLFDDLKMSKYFYRLGFSLKTFKM